MGDQLLSFAGEVTRVAREVGNEVGSRPGQRPGVRGNGRPTDNVNLLAATSTQVRNIAGVTTAVARATVAQIN